MSILMYAQDASLILRPAGFERYRVAEKVNAILTEIVTPLRAAARLVGFPLADALRQQVHAQLRIIEQDRGGRIWLCSETASIADIYLSAHLRTVDPELLPEGLRMWQKRTSAVLEERAGG